MGVKGLFKVIKDNAPDAISAETTAQFANKRVAIDASIAVFQWCSIGRARNIVNGRGAFINHIQGAFFRTVAILSAGITPIYVFDGKAPVAKQRTLDIRRELRAKNETTRLTINVFDEVRKLLTLMGVPVIIAKGEAEATAAALVKADIADAIATEDLDALAFGAATMIRKLDTTNKITVIDLEKVLAGLDLTYYQFVDFCILLGTDYSPTIRGIGQKRALSLIREHKSIENILKHWDAPPDFAYKTARCEFFARIDVDRLGPTKIEFSDTKINEIRNFLILTHGLSLKRVESSLNKLKNIKL